MIRVEQKLNVFGEKILNKHSGSRMIRRKIGESFTVKILTVCTLYVIYPE